MSIEAGSLVVAHCQNPKEKIWGELLSIDVAGVVVRGLDLSSVEDWLRQEREGDERFIAPTTVFVPMHRVERVYLDESSPMASSFADRYAEAPGGDVRDALAGRGREASSD